jgi:hypothetical protein
MQSKCFKSTCIENKCETDAVPNCCGNQMCEKSGGENYCNCEKDCSKDKCEGYKLISKTRYGESYTKYLKYMCNENDECVLDIDSEDVKKIPYLTDRSLKYFTIQILTEHNEPFDIDKDKIKITISLKEISNEIKLPIKIYDFRLVINNFLYGRKEVSYLLKDIGDSFTEELPFDYDMEFDEEQKQISIKFDYEYEMIIDKMGNTDIRRSYYDHSIGSKIYLVKTGTPKNE